MEKKIEFFPEDVVCFDNGGKTLDRFTIIYKKMKCRGKYQYLGASENPSSPLGFGQHGEIETYNAAKLRNVGKKVAFETLPILVQNAVKQDFE